MLNQIERDGRKCDKDRERNVGLKVNKKKKKDTSRLMMETGITLAWPS